MKINNAQKAEIKKLKSRLSSMIETLSEFEDGERSFDDTIYEMHKGAGVVKMIVKDLEDIKFYSKIYK